MELTYQLAQIVTRIALIWLPRHHHLYEHNFHAKKGSAAQALPFLKEKKESSVAILTGLLRDQAELLGVLKGLYNLHLSILKVEVVNSG